ncbi:GNAT family N-acetyltransferase [Microcoleus vaginatus PCC 9802]|uniref:GNAT family N-acetyltransferase n=1 Tax=Microcoleus vaginatus TaxID=119532 RepID=UPI00020D17DB|nr:GCN5-related N-acetyltransferase [Microcoleus vaginatus FGP-2]UNU20592.1 GNAT family N-acetyltransferase [Microcoleus vaginatus PCC 9802]
MIVREAKIADAPAIARVNLDTWRTAYRKIVPTAYLAQLSYEKGESRWQEILTNVKNTGVFVCVAENDSGQIVGFAAGGCERTGKYIYKGELFAIYILEEYQRQGIGRQLVRTVATKLAELSLNSMLVWVLGDNSAYKFYEFLGGEKVDEQQTSRAGVALKEIAYGWKDIAVLINTAV